MNDLVQGMKVKFVQPVFGGSWKRPQFLGERTIVATIIKDSYGSKRGQHTFTLSVESATGYDSENVKDQMRIKGRNLYKGLESIISEPENVQELKDDKHIRGQMAYEQKIANWESEGRFDKIN